MQIESYKKVHCDTFDDRFMCTKRIVTTDMEAHFHIGNEIANLIDDDNVKYIIIQKFK